MNLPQIIPAALMVSANADKNINGKSDSPVADSNRTNIDSNAYTFSVVANVTHAKANIKIYFVGAYPSERA